MSAADEKRYAIKMPRESWHAFRRKRRKSGGIVQVQLVGWPQARMVWIKTGEAGLAELWEFAHGRSYNARAMLEALALNLEAADIARLKGGA